MNVYLVACDKKYATTYNKQVALTLAKKHPASKVYQFYKQTGGIWDAPTFILQADVIYPKGE